MLLTVTEAVKTIQANFYGESCQVRATIHRANVRARTSGAVRIWCALQRDADGLTLCSLCTLTRQNPCVVFMRAESKTADS
jgi:hypothetical protein